MNAIDLLMAGMGVILFLQSVIVFLLLFDRVRMARMVEDLHNRLMARNYAEYATFEVPRKSSPDAAPSAIDERHDDDVDSIVGSIQDDAEKVIAEIDKRSAKENR